MNRSAACIALLLFPTLALAQASPDTDDVMRRAMNNLSHEYTICAAYYSIVAVAGENSGDPDLQASYEKATNQALENAYMVANEAGLLKATLEARLTMAIEGMGAEINNDTANISILLNQHSESCLSSMNDIGGRVEYWTEHEMRRAYPELYEAQP